MRNPKFFRLKAAATDLVAMCGGQERAGSLIGVGQQRVSKILQRDDDAMFNAHAVLALESECGQPVITRVLAEMQGFRLERDGASAAPAPANPYAAIAEISAEYSDVVSEFGLRTADGVFSAADGIAMDRHLADIIAKAEGFRRLIAKQAAGQ